MLVDANLLVYAADQHSPFHSRASSWLEAQVNGPVRVGLPWSSLLAFLRITTNPRATLTPLAIGDAWGVVSGWLAADTVWIPSPGTRHAEILGALLSTTHAGANHVPDAHLAALAIEHGLTVYSNDSDFSRYPGLRWANPLA